MPDTVLIVGERLEAIWRGTAASSIERPRQGRLLEVDGDTSQLAPGMLYRDGAFVRPVATISLAELRREAKRRVDMVFPDALQGQIAEAGGALARSMHVYISGVERASRALEASPAADWKADRHWPEVPSLEAAPVPVVMQPAQPVLHPPINVHVVTESAGRMSSDKSRQVATSPDLSDLSDRYENSPAISVPATNATRATTALSPVSPAPLVPASPPDLAAMREAAVVAIATVAEAHKRIIPAEQRELWVLRLASFAGDITVATTAAGIEAAKTEAMRFIEGKQ